MRVLTETKWGRMLVNDQDKYCGRMLMHWGEFSRGEVECFKYWIKPGMAVADVGANIGAHTLVFSRLVGDRGCVFAYEPQRLIFQMLCANLAINNVDNVFAYNKAVGAREERVMLNSLDPAVEQKFGAIAAMPVPVVSGVGHETDFTIADFVADLRAPTPSAAAELATPVTLDDLRAEVDDLSRRLAETLGRQLRERRQRLAERQSQLSGLSPQARLAHARQQLADRQARLWTAVRHHLALARERHAGLRQTLNSYSPLGVLQRGYAIVRDGEGRIVRRSARLAPGDALDLTFAEGGARTRVEETR